MNQFETFYAEWLEERGAKKMSQGDKMHNPPLFMRYAKSFGF